jgi:hypothetical protein
MIRAYPIQILPPNRRIEKGKDPLLRKSFGVWGHIIGDNVDDRGGL